MKETEGEQRQVQMVAGERHASDEQPGHAIRDLPGKNACPDQSSPEYTDTEQFCNIESLVPIGITESNRKMRCIFSKIQYNF
jgi:hypothetical protein